MTRGEIWDAGKYKDKDGDIIEKFPDGRSRDRFKTVSAKRTPNFMNDLVELYGDAIKDRKVPPLVILAAFNLDFLFFFSFRDGNGRVSRLLMLLQCYHLGIEVGRYISLERLVENQREGYYDALYKSSQGWHDGRHTLLPWWEYFLGVMLLSAYREFEHRTG